MPVEVRHSPPPLHEPTHSHQRPRGILKNPSFSAQGGLGPSPDNEDLPPSTPLDPVEAKELTLQNTLQNAGPRRSSSSARRASASRRHSSAAGLDPEEDGDKMRLKWDEANLFLAEQQSGGRMKITEPKTPYQYGDAGAMDEDEDDVAIDPRYVNVDEVDMAKNRAPKARESEIPGLELGEPEEDVATAGVPQEDERIIRRGNLSRESSKEKHVSVSEGTDDFEGPAGMGEDPEKHRQFEERRKKHYEMRNMKGLLGHPEDMDEEEDPQDPVPAVMPGHSTNGTR